MTDAGKNWLRSTVGAHPVTAGVLIGVLVVIVLALSVAVYHYKNAAAPPKSGFMTQFPFMGNLSNWQLGSGDAGWGGSLQRETTPAQAQLYHAGWRPVGLERSICNSGREGLAVAPMYSSQHTVSDAANAGIGPGCGAGCGPSIACRPGWDPSATAEAQALATLGSLPHDPNGERSLQGAVNAAFDCDSGLSDNQLRDLMHNGGAP
ncbi:MAG: hypothetical protein V4537_14090 [Pseudomonadota bacterium]